MLRSSNKLYFDFNIDWLNRDSLTKAAPFSIIVQIEAVMYNIVQKLKGRQCTLYDEENTSIKINYMKLHWKFQYTRLVLHDSGKDFRSKYHSACKVL